MRRCASFVFFVIHLSHPSPFSLFLRFFVFAFLSLFKFQAQYFRCYCFFFIFYHFSLLFFSLFSPFPLLVVLVLYLLIVIFCGVLLLLFFFFLSFSLFPHSPAAPVALTVSFTFISLWQHNMRGLMSSTNTNIYTKESYLTFFMLQHKGPITGMSPL